MFRVSLDPGIGFPFDTLTDQAGAFQAIEFTYEGNRAVVLWSDDAEGGMAYRLRTEASEEVSLIATGAGIEDEGTGSAWILDGRAVAGPMEGERLVPLERAFVSFWGAWAAFNSDARRPPKGEFPFDQTEY